MSAMFLGAAWEEVVVVHHARPGGDSIEIETDETRWT